MSKEYRYFKVTGGIIKERHNAFIETRKEQAMARKAAAEQYGASGTYGTGGGVTGLVFEEKAPEGWRPVKHEPTVYKPPTGKAGKAIRDHLGALKLSDGADYHKTIQGGEGGFGFFDSGDAGFCIRYIIFEKIEDAVILKVPACDDGDKWTPPDDQCIPLKTSEYWALKESAESKALEEQPANP